MLAMRASARAVASMTSRIGKAFATPTLLDAAGVIGTYIVQRVMKGKSKVKSQRSKVKSVAACKVCAVVASSAVHRLAESAHASGRRTFDFWPLTFDF